MDLWAIQHDSSDELLCWDMLFGTVTLDLGSKDFGSMVLTSLRPRSLIPLVKA